MPVDDTRADGSGSPAVAPDTWIRKRRRTALFAAYALLLSAFWVAMIFDVAAKKSVYEHNGGLPVFVLFFLALAAASAALGLRLARAGLWMSADGIVVRGPLKTWRVSAQAVERFEPSVAGPGNGTPCPTLTRTDGRPIGVWALGSEALTLTYRQHLDDMDPLCEELNRLLATIQASAHTVNASPLCA
jgi:NADH:ubiquinone oxidoreductase subunit K